MHDHTAQVVLLTTRRRGRPGDCLGQWDRLLQEMFDGRRRWLTSLTKSSLWQTQARLKARMSLRSFWPWLMVPSAQCLAPQEATQQS